MTKLHNDMHNAWNWKGRGMCGGERNVWRGEERVEGEKNIWKRRGTCGGERNMWIVVDILQRVK